MRTATWAVGSLAALRGILDDDTLVALPVGGDVVVVATAAAFVGAAQAAVAVAETFSGRDVRVEALMVTDRPSSNETYFVERIAAADLVVLCDGSPLHARAWHHSPVGEAIRAAALLVAIGSVASSLGEIMIDPRGGAPTIGLGYRSGVVISPPASDEQLGRTRSLLAGDVALVVLGVNGVVQLRDDRWRVVRSDGVVVTRGPDIAML